MRKLLTVARQEFSVAVRRPSYIFFTLLLPALMLLAGLGFMGYRTFFAQDRPPIETTVGYVDATGIFTQYREQGAVTFVPQDSQEAGTRALLAGDIDVFYVIPPDYFQTGVVVQVRERRPGIGGSGTQTTALRQFLLDNLLEGQLPPEREARVRAPATVVTLEVDAQGQPVEQPFNIGRFFFFIVLGILVIWATFTSSGFMQEGLSEEKENRIMEVLLSSSSPSQLMLGKLLGLGAVGLAQIVFWVLSGLVLFALFQQALPDLPSITLPSPLLALVGIAFFILGYAFFGTLMAALGAVTTSHREAQQVTFLVVMPAIVPFWLMAALLEHPEGTLARVLSFIPFTSPTASMVRLGMDGMSTLDLVIALVVLVAATALTLALTLRIFRTYLLMYGRRPTVWEVARTLVRG